MQFPVKVYWKRANGTVKVLHARSQAEYDGLLKIGWKTDANGT